MSESKRMNRFGEKLRTLRQRHNFTLQQLGDQVGVAHSHISRLEQSHKTPNAEMILKIADVFGVTTDQLMRDELEV